MKLLQFQIESSILFGLIPAGKQKKTLAYKAPQHFSGNAEDSAMSPREEKGRVLNEQ